MAKIVRSRSPISHIAPNAQILPAIGIKVISPGKNDGISISAPPPPPRTKIHGNNEKIIPTKSMSSIKLLAITLVSLVTALPVRHMETFSVRLCKPQQTLCLIMKCKMHRLYGVMHTTTDGL